jgi:hypothetical protein
VEVGHRDAPLRDAGAAGVPGRDRLEGFRRIHVGEGVQHRHCPLEIGADFRFARGGEVDRAEILRGRVDVLVVLARERGGRQDRERNSK